MREGSEVGSNKTLMGRRDWDGLWAIEMEDTQFTWEWGPSEGGSMEALDGCSGKFLLVVHPDIYLKPCSIPCTGA